MENIQDIFTNQGVLLDVVARITPQWLAGFFDGEGCVSPKIEHHGTIANVRVSITQKDPTILSLISLKFPGGHFSVKDRIISSGTARTKTHELMYTGASCYELLAHIKDHVIVKKEQVLLGLEMCKLVTYSGGKLSEAERAKRIEIAEKIRSINHKNLETTPIDEAVSEQPRDARKDG